MPNKELDPEDPFDLVVTPVSVEEGHDNLEEMARCFAEEYVDMGWSDKVILWMFQQPDYRGPHTAYRTMGEQYVRGLISEARGRHQAMFQRLFGDDTRKEA